MCKNMKQCGAEYIMKQCAKTLNNVGPNISTNLLPTIVKYMKQRAKKSAKNVKQTYYLLEV